MPVTQIRGSNQILSATVDSTRVNSTIIVAAGTNAFTANQSMGNNRITSLADPSAATDAATRQYVDNLFAGLRDLKESARVATTANINLASAPSAIDGVNLSSGERVLVKNQTTGSENGIYVWNGAASAMTRATDADASAEVTAGMFVFVAEGSTNADTGWVLQTNDPITLGTTSLVFVQFTGGASYVAGAGLLLTGNVIDVQATNGSIVVAADAISVGYSGTPVNQAIGDAATAGSSDYPSRNDHRHGMPSFASPAGTSRMGDTNNTGAASTPAASDHRHARENIAISETPGGTINGSNVTFTLANTPNPTSILLFLNGLLQDVGAGNDYTISGLTITFANAPVSGDKIRATYWY